MTREYIDRIALGIGFCNPEIFESKEYARGWNSAIKIIENAPTADVVEVVHEEWIPTGGETLFLREFRCNRCKSRQLGNTNYCPNCGAKMDGKKKVEYD